MLVIFSRSRLDNTNLINTNSFCYIPKTKVFKILLSSPLYSVKQLTYNVKSFSYRTACYLCLFKIYFRNSNDFSLTKYITF